MSEDVDIVKQNVDDTVEIRTKPCWICGQYSYVNVPSEAWRQYDIFNKHLDTAWPNGPAADKQLIRSGVHLTCWDSEFPENSKENNNA